MALPRQVEKQLSEIEELEKSLAQPEAAAEDEAKAHDAPRDPAPGEPDVETEPVEVPAAPEPVEPKPVDWQQKYRTLQGMYDAEVPRLHQQIKELSRKLDDMAAAQAKPEAEPEQKKLVTADDVESFGSDLIDVQRRVAKEVFEEHVIPLRKQMAEVQTENTQLRQQLQQTEQKTTQTSFQARLHQLVPDFDALNSDAKWVAWLDEVDPILRAPRRAVAQQAYTRGDADGVAHYVNLYRSQHVDQSSQKQKELEKQLSPARNASSQPAPSTGKSYTPAEVEKAFQKVATLNKVGKFEDANKLEAELSQAYAEGRVRAA